MRNFDRPSPVAHPTAYTTHVYAVSAWFAWHAHGGDAMVRAGQPLICDMGATGFVAVHVGAGYHAPNKEGAYINVMKAAVKAAQQQLAQHAAALDAVAAAIAVLEVGPRRSHHPQRMRIVWMCSLAQRHCSCPGCSTDARSATARSHGAAHAGLWGSQCWLWIQPQQTRGCGV